MSSVFALLWAYLLLREKDAARRLPGAFVMVIGAISDRGMSGIRHSCRDDGQRDLLLHPLRSWQTP
jgi:hypothetical protein